MQDTRAERGRLAATAAVTPIAPHRAPAVLDWTWRTSYLTALVCVDILAAGLACLLSYTAGGSQRQVAFLGLTVDYTVFVVLSVAIWLVGQTLYGSYRPHFSQEALGEYRSAVIVGTRCMAAVVITSFALQTNLSRLTVFVYFPTLIVLAVAGRFLLRRGLAEVRQRGGAKVRMMLIGDLATVRRFTDHLYRDRSLGYEVVGICVPAEAGTFTFRSQQMPVLGTPDDAVRAAQLARVEAVAVANPSLFEELTIQRLAWALERSGIDLLVAPDVADVAGPRIRIAPVTGLPLLHITEPRVDGVSRRICSVSSRVMAVPLTILLLPVMCLIALLVLIDSGRPILYRQTRVGYKERPFAMLKFRTMARDADERLAALWPFNEHDGPFFKMRRDPRVTRVGRMLRRYSLDELPQLLNVLKGEMVFVGPRPVLPREVPEYGEAGQRRFLAKPGMTGLWQVSGRSTIPWEDAVKLDLYYVENWSPLLDMLLLARTIRAVVAGTGY